MDEVKVEQQADRDHGRGAFEHREAALRQQEAWAALGELYAERLAEPALAAAPEECARLQERRGVLLERYLDDPNGAIQAYQNAARLSPTDTRPLRRLRALYEARNAHPMVLQISEIELARTRDPAQRASLLEHSAAIWANALGDADQAAALRARAEEERRLVAAGPAQPMADPVDEPEAGSGNTAGVESLRRSLATAPAKRAREIHLALAARLETAERDVAAALIHLTRAIELDPGDSVTLVRGLTLAGQVGGELAQLDLLDQAAEGARDAALRARLLAQRGNHLADRLGWAEEAEASWRIAQELDPRCAEARARLQG